MRSIRRSRSAAGLLAVAFLVTASGCGADDTDQLSSPAPPETTDIADEPSATWAPTDNAPFQSVRVVTSTPVEVSAPFDTPADEQGYVPVQWLVPWDDGFLAAGTRYTPQPLPDQLPPDIAALFPPEVTALFPDGLPPTQQEAMDILNEAGLLDVVMDILDEYPDAMDAIQSAPRPDPELVAAWSSDGDTWTPTDLGQPDGLGVVSMLSVSGDRLTLAGSIEPTEDGEPWTMTVASTTDLENWSSERFTLPGTAITAEPEGTATPQVWAGPGAVAADDEHWVMRVVIDVFDEDVSTPRTELWSAAWGGQPVMTESDQLAGMLQSTSDGFLDLGDHIRFSPDGHTWTAVPEAVPEVVYPAAAPFGDGVLAISATPDMSSFVSSIVVLDATGDSVAEVEIPELGDEFMAWGPASSPASSPAFIVQGGDVNTTGSGLWVLATTDGETWLLQDVDEGDALTEIPPPTFVAINGTTVLVGSTFPWEPGPEDVWQRFEITE